MGTVAVVARVRWIEQVGLNEDGGPRLAGVGAFRRHDHDGAARHRLVVVSDACAMNAMASFSDRRRLTRSDCRRASVPKSGSPLPKPFSRSDRTTSLRV